MNSIWYIILLAFLVQEAVLIAPALVLAHGAQFSLILLFLLWIFATIFMVLLGYLLGKVTQYYFQNWKFQIFLTKKAESIEGTLGDKGQNVFLFILGIFYYPYVIGFAASWFKHSMSNVILYIVLGDCLWFVINLGIAYGILQLTTSVATAVILSTIMSLTVAMVTYYLRHKILKDNL